jgi:hypothetical protein
MAYNNRISHPNWNHGPTPPTYREYNPHLYPGFSSEEDPHAFSDEWNSRRPGNPFSLPRDLQEENGRSHGDNRYLLHDFAGLSLCVASHEPPTMRLPGLGNQYAQPHSPTTVDRNYSSTRPPSPERSGPVGGKHPRHMKILGTTYSLIKPVSIDYRGGDRRLPSINTFYVVSV